MSNPRPSNVPPIWTNQDIVLYHGTSMSYAVTIVQNGIDVSKTNPVSDFGQGFYTTTILSQAQNWAWRRATDFGDVESAVLEFKVDREVLSSLKCLWFINAATDATNFWSFVFYCRQGNMGHGLNSIDFYDVVVGPVCAFWQDRVIMANADQISFHTEDAIKILGQASIMSVED